MIAIVEQEVFSAASGLALQSLLHLGYEGRHLIQTDPPYDPSPTAEGTVQRWLSGLDKVSRDQSVLALETGLEQAATDSPPELSIRIAAIDQPNWAASSPRLPLGEGLRLLHQPLQLLLENQHNDGAFLCSVPPAPWRERLRTFLKNGWIELAHGGGSDMTKRIERVPREETLRLWALFDSDAREPGCPSEESEHKRRTCLAKDVAHHQLARRESENYLPPQALQAWAAKSSGNLRAARRRKADTFAGLQPEQRQHYNMKEGFAGDRKHLRNIPALFDSCSTHRDLQTGFGRDIASLFHEEDFPLHEEWLRRDGQHPETLAMVQSILRRL